MPSDSLQHIGGCNWCESGPTHQGCIQNVSQIKRCKFVYNAQFLNRTLIFNFNLLRIGNIYTFLLQQDNTSSIPVVPQLSQRPLISVERLPDMPSKQAVAKYLQDISPPAPKRAPTATLGALTSTGNLVSFLLHLSTLYLYTIRIIHTNKKNLIHLLILFFQEIISIQPQVSTTPDVSTPPMIPTTGTSTASMRKKPVTEVSHFLNTYPFLYLNIFQIDKTNNFVHIKNKLI